MLWLLDRAVIDASFWDKTKRALGSTDRPNWTVPLFRYTSKVSRPVLPFFTHCFLKPASPGLYHCQLRPMSLAYL